MSSTQPLGYRPFHSVQPTGDPPTIPPYTPSNYTQTTPSSTVSHPSIQFLNSTFADSRNDSLSSKEALFEGKKRQTLDDYTKWENTPEDLDLEDEPPLLEELGIRIDDIKKRMKSVFFTYDLNYELMAESDMCGPLVIALTLGICLLLAGKPTFGYIYGLGIIGSIGTYVLLNLMSQNQNLDLYRTMSILGYGLFPVAGLAFVSIFVSLRSFLGGILSFLCVVWCTLTASRFFETFLCMNHQRYLVAYPIFLLYAFFVASVF